MLIISHPSTLMGIENDTHQTRGGTTTIQNLTGIENNIYNHKDSAPNISIGIENDTQHTKGKDFALLRAENENSPLKPGCLFYLPICFPCG